MEQDLEAEIRRIFAVYGAAFDDADAGAVTALFAFPATIWQFGEGHVFEDEEDLAKNVQALIDVFDEAGIVVTIPEVRDFRGSGAAAFATVDWRQEDQAGEALHEFTCHYMIVETNGLWRIATVVNEQDPEDMG